jgi:RNA polymerase sigma-70 factor (ECF subfamily)
MELDDHLFRRESGRLVSVLTRIFGAHNLPLAEDVAQDAFCRAVEVWPVRGIPENPSAWLMATARNRALDVLRRERTARTFAPEFSRFFDSAWTRSSLVDELFSQDAIKDDELRVMFSCCHPRLPEEAQVALMLHIVCGFGVNEIAHAFVSSFDAIKKRITRSKKVFVKSTTLFDVSDAAEFSTRLPTVQRALYLLFNEGYHSASAEHAVRTELCREAMRLSALLLEHPLGAAPATYALSALMCLDAARLPARMDAAGQLHSMFEQDRSQWDRQLIGEGLTLLDLAANGAELTGYHIEAGIAAVHARAAGAEDTDWKTIVTLYDKLAATRPSPVVALNRAIAVAQDQGPERGIEAINAIADSRRLARYPFYAAALGELELRRGRREISAEHFRAALSLARNSIEEEFFNQRILACVAPNVRE